MSERQVHVSTHIVRTAGTTLERFLSETYGSQEILIYNPETDTLFRNQENKLVQFRTSQLGNKLREMGGGLGLTPLAHSLVIRFIRFKSDTHVQIEQPSLMREKFSIIHGHFQANRFDEVIPSRFQTVVLRDPLERAVSHYHYLSRASGIVNHGQKVPWRSDMTLDEFILLPELQNFQTKQLGGKRLQEFDLIGVTEHITSFCERLLEARKPTNGNVSTVGHLNKTSKKNVAGVGEIDPNVIRTFEGLNRLDYSNYYQALGQY